MKVSKVRERRAVLTDTLELRFCRVCGAYPRFSTIAAVTQPDLRAASTIWRAYFTITLWSPDLCKAVILDVGWSTIQSQFLRKPNLRLTDSHRSVILIVLYFISLGRVIEMWICWHYDLCLFTDNIVICAARWEFDDLSYGPKSLTKDRALIPELTLRSIISTHMICIYPFKMGLWDTSRGL